MHQLAHPDGEVATSRAAAKHGVAMGVSSYATYSMEDVISQGSGNPYAFQVTILKDRSLTLKMLRRAESKSPPTKVRYRTLLTSYRGWLQSHHADS
jgi:(S)-2-hydroxy-acid oxidase